MGSAMIHVMIKPASGLCNMRCAYCFYTDTTQKRLTPSYGIMREETLRAVLRKVLAAANRSCVVAFQGGEPTLAGLPFFRTAADSARELNVNNCRISFALQTNGLLLDDEWCAFLAENQFLVGVSLDGVKAM
ncbi:MAG: radical SAM protein, partial [Clostridiales bacterium]|nr:radical SAM protein [Clostridiales bacterium]